MPTSDGGDIRKVNRPSDISEFQMYIEVLRTLGIKFLINWHATKEEWQKDLQEAGYNLTALACNIIQVGDIEYLFSSGQAHWERDRGFGPSGAFLLSKNKRTKEVQRRLYYNLQNGNLVTTVNPGLPSLRTAYKF